MLIGEINRNKKGFTLIELIVVMIIIGILILLATPRFIRYVEQARYTRIVNDIGTLETVVVPDMVRNNMQFPKGTDENIVCNLAKAAKEDKAYMKDGIIAKGTSKDTEEFKKDFVGKISEVGADDIETGFYKLSYDEIVKPETKTRLKGQFFINKDGDVVYVDGKEVEGTYKDATEAGGKVDRTGVFRYKSDDPTSPDSGVIVGANVEHEYWDKLKTDEVYDIRIEGSNRFIKGNYYDGPQFPNTRMIEDKLVPITEIGYNAFNRIVALKSFSDNTHMLNGEFKIGENVKTIGGKAFKHNKFDGKFEAKNIATIGEEAFKHNKFSGKFEAKNIETIGNYAFDGNRFRGEFEAAYIKSIGRNAFKNSYFFGKLNLPSAISIENLAFSNSTFTEEFNLPEIKFIGEKAFIQSVFNGEFKAPKVENIGIKAFENSKFTGSFSADKLLKVESNAFQNSNFTGDFDGAQLRVVKDFVFQNSKFKGHFNAPKLKEVGNRAFFNSKFIGDFTPEGIEFIDWQAFHYSEFTGRLNALNLEKISSYSLTNSEFKGSLNAPKLTKISEEALRKSKFTGNLNAPNVKHVGNYGLEQSEFEGEFILPKLESVGGNAFLNSKFIGELDTSELFYVGTNAFGRSEFSKIKISKDVTIMDGYGRGIGKVENNLLFRPKRRRLNYLGEAFGSTVKSVNFTKEDIIIVGEDRASEEEIIMIEHVKNAIMNNDYWSQKYGYKAHGTEEIILY